MMPVDANMDRFNGKIFGIGFHKTGTTSLAAALRLLGYHTVHGDSRKAEHGGDEGVSLLRQIAAEDYDLPTLSRYQAFTDNPYFSIWRQLHDRFPNARFILTERDETSWLSSCLRYYAGRRIRPMRLWMFGDHADPAGSEQAARSWLTAYRRHNAAIRDHFGPDSEQLLIMNPCTGEGWDKLCPFLGVAPPDRPFPHSNKTLQFPALGTALP